MELSAVGERVFAAESIIKRRIRKVRGAAGPARPGAGGRGGLPPTATTIPPPPPPGSGLTPASPPCVLQGRIEYLVKWKGWAIK